ncbi:hypothetical protein CBF36_10985 [Vagococcus bubulae]|uniref:DUF3784 domain-containing protein n=1 Tax=Vagococcus bubulae TaxID=1977868 RepID=A0A429ZAQ5_9ENTE|nr:hypothetical protein CBF36_10985 [Vagococcus bubulae]
MLLKMILLVFAFILCIISYFLSKKQQALLVVFTEKNQSTLKNFSISLLLLAVIGIVIGLFFATKLISLIYIFIVLCVSSIFSIILSQNIH